MIMGPESQAFVSRPRLAGTITTRIEVDGRQGDLLLSGCGRHKKDLMLGFFISHPCNNSYILQASSIE